MKKQAAIFWALTARNCAIMRSHMLDFIINAALIACLEALSYGYLLPAFGMNKDLIFPMFLGTILLKFIYIGNEKSFRDAADLDSTRYIDYQVILPLSRSWLFFSWVVSYILELTVQAFFPLLLGALIISSMISLSAFNFGWLVLVHIFSVLYCALFFLTITFGFSFVWMLDNMWARFLVPLMMLSSVFYPWKDVWAVSPFFGNIFLCNPFTYICEGYRGAFLGASYSIHPGFCVIILAIFSLLQAIFLHYAFKKGMDPV